jgi:hypothetical protein
LKDNVFVVIRQVGFVETLEQFSLLFENEACAVAGLVDAMLRQCLMRNFGSFLTSVVVMSVKQYRLRGVSKL